VVIGKFSDWGITAAKSETDIFVGASNGAARIPAKNREKEAPVNGRSERLLCGG